MLLKIVRSWRATVLARDRGKATRMGDVVTGPRLYVFRETSLLGHDLPLFEV